MDNIKSENAEYFCPENHVETKEHIYFLISVVFSILIYGTYFVIHKVDAMICAIFFVIVCIIVKSLQAIVLAQLKQNAIKVTEEQFSLIYEKVKDFSSKLNFKKLPEVYMLQSGGSLNAFATRFLFKNYIVLYSDIMELAYKEGEDAVAFVVAHELAHLHRNHILKYTLTFPSICVPALKNAFSRACETTCDNIATALVPNNSLEGLLVLLAGKELYKKEI